MKTLGAISANLETSTRAREFVSLARAIALSGGTVTKTVGIADDARLSPAVKEILADRHEVYRFRQHKGRCRGWHDSRMRLGARRWLPIRIWRIHFWNR